MRRKSKTTRVWPLLGKDLAYSRERRHDIIILRIHFLGEPHMRQALVIIGFALLSACTSIGTSEVGNRGLASEEQAPKYCVAIRGNGPLITSHWVALARLLDTGHLITGGAGGSSGSITLFLYESMLQNPQLTSCNSAGVGSGNGCSEAEMAARASLLVKSLFTYLEVIKNTNEAATLLGLSKSVQVAIGNLKSAGAAPSVEEIASIRMAIVKILADPSLKALVNAEFIKFVTEPGLTPEVQGFRLREAKRSLEKFGDFGGSDSHVLYQPGVFDFREVARRIGWIGDFYAGRGSGYDGSRMQNFLDKCSGIARGLTWSDLGAKDGGACRNLAFEMMTAYRAVRSVQPDTAESRINNLVGSGGHFLVSTSVLEAPEWAKLQVGMKRYAAGDAGYNLQDRNIYDKLNYGYFGNDRDLKKIQVRSSGSSDLKTSKAAIYRNVTWLEALSRSPAEPGLASIVGHFQNGGATAGGWNDLAPVQQLKNIECQNVTYITRRGEDSVFGQQIARLFGMSDQQWEHVYNLKNPQSSLNLALQAADQVLCTNWDYYKPQQISLIEKDAYGLPSTPPGATLTAPGVAPWLGCGGTSVPEARPTAVAK
jgi:hypothetical protein